MVGYLIYELEVVYDLWSVIKIYYLDVFVFISTNQEGLTLEPHHWNLIYLVLNMRFPLNFCSFVRIELVLAYLQTRLQSYFFFELKIFIRIEKQLVFCEQVSEHSLSFNHLEELVEGHVVEISFEVKLFLQQLPSLISLNNNVF